MAVASASPLPAAPSTKPATAPSPPAPASGFLALRGAPRLRPAAAAAAAWRRLRVEAIRTQREKQRTEVPVEESAPVREAAAPLDGVGADDPMVPSSDESWVVRLEQSFNIFATESMIMVLDGVYRDRNYARFFVLETIARVPYFAFISVLHMYETFGWWRRADYLKVHFAQSWNEFHHLLIMEELGGDALWIDRFLARFMAFFYYFMTVAMYMVSPRMAYHFSECVERHAYSTYDKFLKLHEEKLKRLPAPEAALNYYLNEDLYLFDEFQSARIPCSRRPKIDNLYDVFVNIRDDEAEHCKTMKACQTHGNLRSPHSVPNCLEADSECVIPEDECEGIVDCVKKSLTK
ncbi:ubiquinol oxidase 4, chloroplastic/chromoplastic-like [Miscanthus floridulus]|uniref:ubiquinol oxidase 4, chloroplastic/chromoplastic-like n=1 Tax=Miscanthus floridulus TaxID=154761 RepID=UPI00345A1179